MNVSYKGMSREKQLLKEACLMTGAHWAAWIDRKADRWIIGSHYGLNQARQQLLQRHIENKKITSWLAGAISSSRSRRHALNELAPLLRANHLHAYPRHDANQLLLIGSDQMEHTADAFFRFFIDYLPFVEPSVGHPPKINIETHLWPFASYLEASYDPQSALQSILEYLSNHVPCDAAYLAIRYGDIFQIQATWKCDPGVKGLDIPLAGNPPLQHILTSRKGWMLPDHSQFPDLGLPDVMNAGCSWLGVPVTIGRQVIGLVAFILAHPNGYTSNDVHHASQQVNPLANYVESAIIFSEAARYLQRLALLNDLASTAALGGDPESTHPGDDFARRVMIRLRREFSTDWAAILLLSADGITLQESGGGSLSSPPWVVPVEGSLIGQAVKNGRPVRVNDLLLIPDNYPLRQNLRSELAVPLKFRGKVIGALVLVSEAVNAFSIQDEQLLVVIGSHLAGLFENVRLNEETRERADNLADSVRQLQAVRDTSLDLAGDLDMNTLLKRVAQRARDLVGARGAELGLYDDTEQVVEMVVSETPWENVQGVKIPLMAGVAGQIAAFGEPLVIENYHCWPGRLFPEQLAPYHAVAGVPLKFKGKVIGTLTVLDDRAEKVFVDEDVQLLELLAPQAAISIRNARLYQELEKRVQAQMLAEARLIRSARLAAVGEMAAGVAHELNNPLTTVTGFVELALETIPSTSQVHSDLELVLQEAHRARSVVNRLLDFSRPGDDQRTRANVNELIIQVLPLFHHLAHTSGIRIITDLAQGLPWISMDVNQIKQVFINLFHNAIQAMPHGGILTISSKTEQPRIIERSTRLENAEYSASTEWVSISVNDTGEGIPEDILQRIFEPFFSTRPAGKGTGLGLSVSYGIITSHGGWIEADSRPGHGSIFRIYMPALE